MFKTFTYLSLESKEFLSMPLLPSGIKSFNFFVFFFSPEKIYKQWGRWCCSPAVRLEEFPHWTKHNIISL